MEYALSKILHAEVSCDEILTTQKENFTATQKQRLTELNAPAEVCGETFGSASLRDDRFRKLEAAYARQNRDKLITLVEEIHNPLALRLEAALSERLMEEEGFTRVVTPIIISAASLEKMTITGDHPLARQVFWLNEKGAGKEPGKSDKCLRPMLAPGLYVLMRDMHRILKRPVRIFECGPCFRKETQGAKHMNEFTMLNLVEHAANENRQMERLKELAHILMKVATDVSGEDINYELITAESEVYGKTLDIMVNDIEIGSGSFGPHPLDDNWGVCEPWVGIGIGIERLAMVMGGYSSIKRWGRSTAYVDGTRLNI